MPTNAELLRFLPEIILTIVLRRAAGFKEKGAAPAAPFLAFSLRLAYLPPLKYHCA